jgi:concentrative nucleoside transporter, CNT family
MLSLLHSPTFARLIGIIFVLLIGFIFSSEKKKIDWRGILGMLATIFAFSYVFLSSSIGIKVLSKVASGVESLYKASEVGIEFLFGSLANSSGPCGWIFAIKVLPIIIFFSAIISALRYIGLVQFLVEKIGLLIKPIFRTSGIETLCTTANSFLGQTEAPLLIKYYLKDASNSEIFAIMVGGMGTISGGILAVYAAIGIPVKHLLVSSIISIPSTLLISKLFIPESKKTLSNITLHEDNKLDSITEAISVGAIDGMKLAFNVGTMLIVIISLLKLIDNGFWYLSELIKYASGSDLNISLETIFQFIAYPFSWMLGIPHSEIPAVAKLIGLKVAVNEMIAYTAMSHMVLNGTTVAIATYALCGFSNFSSIGIQIGGIGGMNARIGSIIGKFGVRAVFAAALANLLSACIAGFFIA